MTVRDLNEQISNIQKIKNGLGKIKDGIIDTTKKTVQTIKDEMRDNKQAIIILKNHLLSKFGKTKKPTPEEFKKALEQLLKDNPRLLVIGGIAATPGSAITLPLVMKVAKKLNIQLSPKKTF